MNCQKCGSTLVPAKQTLTFDGSLKFDGTANFNNEVCPHCHLELIKEKFEQLKSVKKQNAISLIKEFFALLGALLTLLQVLTSMEKTDKPTVNQTIQQIYIIQLYVKETFISDVDNENITEPTDNLSSIVDD